MLKLQLKVQKQINRVPRESKPVKYVESSKNISDTLEKILNKLENLEQRIIKIENTAKTPYQKT